MRPKAKLFIGLAVVLGLVLWWAVAEGPLRDPHDALGDFYEARDRAEDQLMDPLILNGRRVVPVVLEELPQKDMRLRRYAIGFLGNGCYRAALPVLEGILADDAELDLYRADALSAIHRISPERARELAPSHADGEALLGEIAADIVSGRHRIRWRRTYWQAFLHAHE